MTAQYRKLVTEARAACERRGHSMRTLRRTLDGKETGYAECRVCRASVSVDTRPMPNGIDISGSAVAVNCPAGKWA